MYVYFETQFEASIPIELLPSQVLSSYSEIHEQLTGKGDGEGCKLYLFIRSCESIGGGGDGGVYSD